MSKERRFGAKVAVTAIITVKPTFQKTDRIELLDDNARLAARRALDVVLKAALAGSGDWDGYHIDSAEVCSLKIENTGEDEDDA